MIDGRPVVVGVDGSNGSDAAVQWAAREASRRDLPLRVVHAARPTHLPTMRSTAVAATVDWMDAAEEVAAAAAHAARQSYPALPVEAEVYLNETPARALTGEGKSAALLVLGARGREGLARRLRKSTAVRVIRLTAIPVVVVRGSADQTGSLPATGEVVVGVNASESSRRAVRFAVAEAALHGTTATAVHAWTRPWRQASRSQKGRHPRTAAALAESIAAVSSDFPDVPIAERLINDRADRALVEASRGAGLLVVGSRGLGGLTGRVFGSISGDATRRAHCPVAVIR